jgi:hypothetical protein
MKPRHFSSLTCPIDCPIAVADAQTGTLRGQSALSTGLLVELRGRDSNPDYLIQSQASYH